MRSFYREGTVRLQRGLPKAVQVAVSVDGHGGLALGEGEDDLGIGIVCKHAARTAVHGLKVHPTDVVLLAHRVLDATDRDLDGIALDRDDGEMLLDTGVGRLGGKLGHLLTAADHRDARCIDNADKIAALLTYKKLNFFHYIFSARQ